MSASVELPMGRSWAMVVIAVLWVCTLTSDVGAAIAKPKVNSFDCFDTIVGRLHKDPRSVFHYIEKNFPLPGFASMRIEAERHAPGTLNTIYDSMISRGLITATQAAQLRAFEVQAEMLNDFPIMENIRNINDGDIIVSDTYYTAEELDMILKNVGLTKKVTLFASYGGKSSGKIWPVIAQRYDIISHIGNNSTSDGQSPQKHGIEAYIFKGADYSRTESTIATMPGGHELADLMRMLRLSNPHQKDTLKYRTWDEQTQLNIPVLLSFSFCLDRFCKKKNKNSILFSARDCCLLIKIFPKLFPSYDSTYFLCSRRVYEKPSPAYLDYVRSLYTPDTVIVDGHVHTSKHSLGFFKVHFNTVPTIVAMTCTLRPDLCLVKASSEKIEELNPALVGSLADYSLSGPIFFPLEHSAELVTVTHTCIEKCVTLLEHYKFDGLDEHVLTYTLNVVANSNPTFWAHHVIVHKKERPGEGTRTKNAAPTNVANNATAL